MSVAVMKKRTEESPADVTQYWLCLKLGTDRQGAHIYFLDGDLYAVTGYIAQRADAVRMCGPGKCVAEVKVHNYLSEDLLAHKNSFIFQKWVLIRPAKAPE